MSKVVVDHDDPLTQVNSRKFFFDTNYFNLLLVVSSLQFPDFQSQFSMSKIIGIFLNLFLIEDYCFRGMFFYHWYFFKTSIFEALYFLKMSSIFVGSEAV